MCILVVELTKFGPNRFMFTTNGGLIMANEVRYTYNGKEVGGLRKLVSDVVVVEEQWIKAANQFFANGYAPLLKFPKALIRQECGEELTDAQAWMLLHHITNSGVPLALRDTTEDEKSRPAKVAGAVAGAALGTLDTAVSTVTNPVSKAAQALKKNAPEETESPDLE
jgi:hypothetical protein